jgi:hypothetical protein
MSKNTPRDIASSILAHSADDTVLVGPVVRDQNEARYLIVATHDGTVTFPQKIEFESLPALEARRALIAALMRPGVLVVDFDDELEMARQAFNFWKCPVAKKIADETLAERMAS